MRIVYLLTSLGMGGAERQVVALAERLAKRGHVVALLVLRPRLAEEWPTSLVVVHLDIYRRPFSVLVGLLRARRFLARFRPHLMHSHSFHANLVARLLVLIAPAHTLICTIHNVYEGDWERMLAYRLTDGLSRCTTAVSKAAALRFVSLRAVPQSKCIVLSNGIDIDEFVPCAKRRILARKQMNVMDRYVWLAAGRMVPAKDYSNLLRAFARVRTLRLEAQLWIAGEAAGAEFNRVTALAAKLGLGDQVRWLGLRRDLPALLDAADAFVLSSAWEGMPLALGEAMAMQKPVVATGVGGVRELVGDAGSIVPAKRPEALAHAMQETMKKTAQESSALGLKARERIVKNFSMDAKADEWEALYSAIQKHTHAETNVHM